MMVASNNNNLLFLFMKALVGVKRVIDYTVKIRVKSDKSGVEKNSVKFSINPFCEIAVEEAIRMKEKGLLTHVTAVSIGDKTSQETLRHALALGADDAYHILTPGSNIDTELPSLAVSKVFQHLINLNNYQIVLLGKQSIDSDYNQTAQLLSGLLNWPLVTFASEIVNVSPNVFKVTREIDSGLQQLKVEAPFVISCDLRLNTPRYSTLKNITAVRIITDIIMSRLKRKQLIL